MTRLWQTVVGRRFRGTADLRPVSFRSVTPPPERGEALQTVAQLVGELIRNGAVDGATGDALDRLIDSWRAQWQSGLVAEATAREAVLRRLLRSAESHVVAAAARAESARAATDDAEQTYAVLTGADGADTHPSVPRQVTNDVRYSRTARR